MKKILQKLLLLTLYSSYMFATAGESKNLISLIRNIPEYAAVPTHLLLPAIAVARFIVTGRVKKTKKIHRSWFGFAFIGGIAPWIAIGAYEGIRYQQLPKGILWGAAFSIPITLIAFATEISTDKQVGAFSVPLGVVAGLSMGAACGYLSAPLNKPFVYGAWKGLKYSFPSLLGYTVAETLQQCAGS